MENEITPAGKIIAGLLLIILTAACIIVVVGYWPDRLPSPGSKLTLYSGKIFHVKLLDSNALAGLNNHRASGEKKTITIIDSVQRIDSASSPDTSTRSKIHRFRFRRIRTIDLNTLLLLLVAVGGFLGNMIHISTSLTTFIGAGQFKRSWILWYCVKPFTASALAITLYFAFRAGFLNYSSDASNINLFGVMTLAIMAGLFTDIATQKLKEIFHVAFRPKDDRPNKLNGTVVSVSEITPDKLDKTTENTILIKGGCLDQAGLIFKINSEPVKPELAQSTLVTIKYTVPATQAMAVSFKLEIFGRDGQLVQSKVFST